jgi:7,8-dihydropterin-6-yl-methyl-4-(beta-D-ribofuranosyl)aminobenzene 5'-phosphate synthase
MAALAARYSLGRAQAESSWLREVEPRLSGLGEVDEVRVLPLVERLTPSDALRGEPGVSYLITAGATRVLFDTGFNLGKQPRSALADNAEALGASLDSLDAIVISHLHADHVGGVGRVRRRTFAFADEPMEPRGIPAYVPTDMSHPRADVAVTTEPRVIAKGIAVLPPLPRMMFWLGPVAEQALAINVRGFGLVVVTGCGHPPIERILGVTERVLDVPIQAVVGGLHLPVHPFGAGVVPQAVIGNPHWPWQLPNEWDAQTAIAEIAARGPQVVALSSHDSSTWTFTAFAEAFGDRYRTLRVGEELRITGPPPQEMPTQREPIEVVNRVRPGAGRPQGR